MQTEKPEYQQDMVETAGDDPKAVMGVHATRTEQDNMSVWEAVKQYKRVSAMCMIAAFSASLDGYQINLNGSIVSNSGFIHTLFGKTVKASPGKYVSAWGGIQSAGQFIGQAALQYVTDRLGRKMAMYIIWVVLVISIAIETNVKHWEEWLVAKLFSGLGVGMMQATIPVYISEHAPNQLRGFLINAYSFWFVVGQLMGPLALREIALLEPSRWRIAIYTQWAMLGLMIIIYVLLPESPWWLVSKGRTDQAEKILIRYNGHVAGYDAKENIGVMQATIEEERRVGAETNSLGWFGTLKGTNGWRFLIASWPKVMQQLVGLSVFNTYATYFFQLAGNKNPFTVTVILACVQLASVLISAATTDKFGRRPQAVYGYSVTVVSVLCLGIVGCFKYETSTLGSLLIFFACLATFSTTAASAIGYAYAVEIPQQRLRARTAGWALAFSNLFGIMFSFCTPLMLAKDGANWGPKAGFFFAGTGAVSVVIGWFILPEVAQRIPAEIDEMFEKKVRPRDFKKYRTEVQINSDLAAGRSVGDV